MEMYLAIGVGLVGIILMLLVLHRQSRQADLSTDTLIPPLMQALAEMQQLMHERTEKNLRESVEKSAQANRQEMVQQLFQFQQSVNTQMTNAATVQNQHITGFAEKLERLGKENVEQLEKMREGSVMQAQQGREEQAQTLRAFAESLTQTVNTLTQSNTQRMTEIRATLEEKLRELQQDNAKKLEEMRQTVDEKLHATLETRLGESFKLVSERLEKVHQGLGEMQQLAMGVGDLKRMLTNVKTRGTWGEIQLEMLLEQTMTPDQYAKNVETIPGSGARVEFAIRLPGSKMDDSPVWLPIDAKFPKEQYERLCDAAELADAEGVLNAGKELERVIRTEAKTIAEKYLSPPHTTDYALLFLPTEGLYAEVMRRPGLSDVLQRENRVVIAGPSTLSALLNSLQMGFRTLALEKRSSEVWQILGAVKTEFGKFGDVLAATKKTLERAAKNIEDAEVRSRQMSRKLKTVEALPTDLAQELLGSEVASESDTGNEDSV